LTTGHYTPRQRQLDTTLRQDRRTFSKERDKKHQFWNTNWLLLGWVPHPFAEIRGGKTGYIPASGYNVAVEIGAGDGRALDVVVLGAENNEARFEIARDMAQWMFENFQWPHE
jgi:D-alanyl-D-alanine carboxypeptidase